MIIPHRLLSPDALRGVIEAFVTREGTDYGAQDVPLATKVFQVQQQLDAGTAILVYDETQRVARFSLHTSSRTVPEEERRCMTLPYRVEKCFNDFGLQIKKLRWQADIPHSP